MKLSVPALRWGLAATAAGALLLGAAPAASAAGSPETSPRQTQSIRAAGSDAGPLSSYRGIQGGNLCLLARCAVGESGPAGHAGPSNTQGFNLCLLAVCTVRP